MIRILYMGNNLIGLNVLEWLKARKENVIGLVIHPPEKAKFAEEMKKISKLGNDKIFEGSKLKENSFLERIKELKPDAVLSVGFDYVLSKEVIKIPPRGCINLHSGLLPYNRGQYPNVWSIVEETPAGATLHYIDEGIDAGDIIAQKEVKIEFTDTGETLFHKLEKTSLELFKETWPSIKNGTNKRIKQVGKGTYHRTRDVERIDHIDLNRKYKAKDLLNILRARTFSPYKSAYVKINGKKVFVRVKLEEDENSYECR